MLRQRKKVPELSTKSSSAIKADTSVLPTKYRTLRFGTAIVIPLKLKDKDPAKEKDDGGRNTGKKSNHKRSKDIATPNKSPTEAPPARTLAAAVLSKVAASTPTKQVEKTTITPSKPKALVSDDTIPEAVYSLFEGAYSRRETTSYIRKTAASRNESIREFCEDLIRSEKELHKYWRTTCGSDEYHEAMAGNASSFNHAQNNTTNPTPESEFAWMFHSDCLRNTMKTNVEDYLKHCASEESQASTVPQVVYNDYENRLKCSRAQTHDLLEQEARSFGLTVQQWSRYQGGMIQQKTQNQSSIGLATQDKAPLDPLPTTSNLAPAPGQLGGIPSSETKRLEESLLFSDQLSSIQVTKPALPGFLLVKRRKANDHSPHSSAESDGMKLLVQKFMNFEANELYSSQDHKLSPEDITKPASAAAAVQGLLSLKASMPETTSDQRFDFSAISSEATPQEAPGPFSLPSPSVNPLKSTVDQTKEQAGPRSGISSEATQGSKGTENESKENPDQRY